MPLLPIRGGVITLLQQGVLQGELDDIVHKSGLLCVQCLERYDGTLSYVDLLGSYSIMDEKCPELTTVWPTVNRWSTSS